MDFRFLLCLCLALCGNLGCQQDYISADEETYEDDDEKNQVEQPPPAVEKPAPAAEDDPPQEEPEEGLDPCPEVTYILWEQDGIKYEVTITVFCDPSPVFNLGCPGPEV